MIFLTTIPACNDAIMTFAVNSASKLSSAVQTLFSTAASNASPVDNIVDVAECLYANQSAITDAPTQSLAQTLAGQLAAFAAQYAWHGMDQRGPGITAAMRRDLGETAPTGTSWPATSADPAPLSRWLVG